MKSRLEKAGVAGVVVMQVTGKEKEMDTLVYVETLVYSLKQDKLVWAGKSKTTNPSRIDEMIKEIVAGAVADMQKAGLIPKQ